jgi:hypothetical protein
MFRFNAGPDPDDDDGMPHLEGEGPAERPTLFHRRTCTFQARNATLVRSFHFAKPACAPCYGDARLDEWRRRGISRFHVAVFQDPRRKAAAAAP